MLRTTSAFVLITVFLLACVSRKNTEAPIVGAASVKTGDTSRPVVASGSDADGKGCRKSAGYTWSAIRNECIRPWETGIPLLKKKEGLTSAAYLLLSDDGKTAELFCAELKAPALMTLPGKTSNIGASCLYEDRNSCWTLMKEGNTYSLNCGAEKVYHLPDSAASARTRFDALKR